MKDIIVKILKFSVILLLMAGSFSSCERMNTSEEVFEPIVPDDNVIAFFEEHLPPCTGMASDCFFVDVQTWHFFRLLTDRLLVV